jgi:hypothetical protein
LRNIEVKIQEAKDGGSDSFSGLVEALETILYEEDTEENEVPQ